MKRIEQKAIEYGRMVGNGTGNMDFGNVACDAFEAGYKSAFEWTSVKDRLPDTDRGILASNRDDKTVVWTSNMDMKRGIITPISFTFWGTYYATHWREIEIPE